MSAVPDATELAMLRGGVESWMQTAIVLCTKTGTRDSGGSTETITEGATVYGRLYSQNVLQQLGTSSNGGTSAMVTVTAQYIEIPAANTLKVKDMVRIGTLYYEVTEDSTAVDSHTLISNSYKVRRLDVGVR